MPHTIHATPLTVDALAAYGGVISTDVVTSRTVSVNNGTARRTPEVVPTENLYHKAASGIPGRTVLNVSLASPRETIAWAGDGWRRSILKINVLEKHPYSTQSFIPMGSGIKYLVVVTDGGDEPNLEGLKAFVATDEQGVCYGAGVWHAPMSVVGDKAVSYAVVQNVNGVPEEDCVFHHLDEEIEIVF